MSAWNIRVIFEPDVLSTFFSKQTFDDDEDDNDDYDEQQRGQRIAPQPQRERHFWAQRNNAEMIDTGQP